MIVGEQKTSIEDINTTMLREHQREKYELASEF